MRRKPGWQRLVTAPLLLFASPVFVFYLLHATGSLPALLGYGASIELSFLLIALRRWPRTATVAAGTLLAAGAVAIYAALDITPASAFLAWFELARGGEAGGTVSYMFCLFFAYFSALSAAILLVGDSIVAMCVYLFVHAFLAAVILASVPLALTAALVLLAFVILQTLRRLRGIRLAPLFSILQVVAVAGLAAAALAPSALRNPLVDGLFSVGLERPVAELFPGFPFLYNVPGYGHSLPQSARSTPPTLTSRPVFRVTAAPGDTIYLRTAAYDTYGPDGWVMSAAAKKAASGKTAGLAIGRGSPVTSAGGARIRVEVLIDFFANIPAPLDAVSVTPLSGKLPPLSYGSPETGYLLTVPVTRGFVFVEAQSRRPPGEGPVGTAGSETRSLDLETAGLPLRVRELAAELKRGSPVQTLTAIRSYLANHYTYNLDIRPYRAGTNPVGDFLFSSHQGYCVQFATSLALLARIDGIPTRYVTGFLVNLPENSDTTVVTGLSSHAWVEALLPGRGWTTVEATPPMMRSSMAVPDYYQDFNPSGSQYTERQLLAIMGNRVEAPSKAAPIHHPFPHFAAAAVLVLLLLAGLLRSVRLALMPRPARLRRLARLSVRRSSASGIPGPASCGWRCWAAEAGAAAGRRAPLQRAALIVQGHLFGGRPASQRDLRFLLLVKRLLRTGPSFGMAPLHRRFHSVQFRVRSSRQK